MYFPTYYDAVYNSHIPDSQDLKCFDVKCASKVSVQLPAGRCLEYSEKHVSYLAKECPEGQYCLAPNLIDTTEKENCATMPPVTGLPPGSRCKTQMNCASGLECSGGTCQGKK